MVWPLKEYSIAREIVLFISLDNKLMFYQVLYFYFCWLISEFVVQAGNSEVIEVQDR